MIAAALSVAVAVSAAQAPPSEPPALDLPALVATTIPAGFNPLPDQPGRLGPLDAAGAAAVLDRSGQTPPERLVQAGFRRGYAKAWSKPETQEVILDVLVEFGDDEAAEVFARRVVESRARLASFEVPGVPDAVGFERGPATPTAADPAQREVVVRRGRVVAIVVMAGHVARPEAAHLDVVVQGQWQQLQAVPVAPETEADDGGRRVRLALLAQVLLTVVLWRTVVAVRRTPQPLIRR